MTKIIHRSHTNFFLEIFIILGFFFQNQLLAQTIVIPGSIACIDNSSYTVLPDIIISESNYSDFSNGSNQTYIISAPANFNFNPINPTVTTSGGNLTLISVNTTSSTLQITYNLINTINSPVDGFTINGLQIKPNATSASGSLFRTGGTAIQNSNSVANAQNHGNVSSQPIVSLISDDADNKICQGTNITFTASPIGATSYQFTLDGISNPASASNTFSTSTLSSGAHIVNVSLKDINGCSSVSNDIAVIVNVTPTTPVISIVSGSSVFCEVSGNSVTLESSLVGISYQWYKNGLAVTGQTGQTLTLSTSSQSGNYTVRAYGPGPTSCPSLLSVPRAITINAVPGTPTITVTSGAVSFCEDGGTTSVTLSSSLGSSYQWYQDGVALTGQTSQTLTLNSNSQSGDYQVRVFGPGPTNCPSPLSLLKTITIGTVPSTPVINIIGGVSSFCEDGGVTTVVLKSSVLSSSYQWYKNGSVVTGQTGQTLTLSTSSQSGNYTVRAYGPGPTNCPGLLSSPQAVTINAVPGTPTITVTSGTVSFCDNGGGNSVTLQSSVSLGGYQWYKNGSLTGFTTQSIVLNSSSQTGDYQVKLIGPGPTNCPSGLSASKTISINAAPSTPVISIVSGSSAFCEVSGNSVTLESSLSGVSYQWYKNGLALTGQTNQAIVLSLSSESGSYTVVALGTGPTGCPSVSSSPQAVTINAVPGTPTITVTSGAVSFCEDGGTTSVTLSSSLGSSYQWYQDGVALTGQTSQTLTLNSNSQSGDYQVRVFGPGPTNCPSPLSLLKTITIGTVPSTPAINIIGGVSSFCENGGVTTVVLKSSVLSSSYQWYKNGLAVTGQTGQTLTLSTSSQSGNYTVMAYGPGPTNCPGLLSSPQAITINAVPGTPTITVTSGAVSFCEDGGTTSVTLSSSLSSSYQWYQDGVALTGQTSQTLTLNSNSQSGDYQVRVFGPGPTNCPSPLSLLKTITIGTVPSTPVINIIGGVSSFCENGGVTTVVLKSSVLSSSYQWYKNGSAVTGQTGQTLTLSTSSQSGNYTVRAYGPGPTSCPSLLSVPQAITINAVPGTPTITVTSGTVSFCEDGGTTSVTLSSSLGSSYQWYQDGVALTGQTSQTLTLNSNSQSGDYQVRVFGPGPTNCPSPLSLLKTITIGTVPSTPAINIIGGVSSFCENGGVTTVVLKSSVLSSSYQWYKNGSAVTGQTGQTLTLSTSIQSGNYTVRAYGPGPTSCPSLLSVPRAITINAVPGTPTITVTSGTVSFCEDGGTTSVTLSSSLGSSYQWYQDGVALTGQTSQTLTLNSNSQSGDYQVRVFGPGPTNCPSPLSLLKTITIGTVPSTPVINIIGGVSSFCEDGGVTTVVLKSSVLSSSYQWYKNGSAVTGQTGQTLTLSTSSQSGNYTVRAYGPGPTNCPGLLSSPQAVTINAVPGTPTITVTSGTVSFCDNGGGNSVTLQSSVSPGGYQWYKNGSLTGFTTQSIVLNSSSQTGDYQVKLIGPGPTNCPSASSSITNITIYPQVLNATTSVQNPTICTGSSTNIIISSSQSGVNYQLYKGATPVGPVVSGTGGNINLPTGVLLASTTFNIKAVNPTTFCNLNLTPTRTVTISAAVTANAGTNQTVCQGAPVTLNATTTGPVSSVTWSGGIGILGTANSLSTSYTPNPSEYGSTIIFTITTNDPDGAGPCSAASSQVSVKINALPSVLFSGLNTTYCVDAPTVTLTGFPSGGTFSGPGISGNTFSPAGLSGNNLITYTFTDANGCTNSTSKSTTVNPLPVVSYSGLFSTYQLNAASSTLIGSPSGGTFSGPGIIGDNFYPGFAGVGLHSIRYTYSDIYGCSNFQDQMTDVQPAPVVDFTGLPSNTCIDRSPYLLTGTPSGGVFSGAGIVGNYFDPSIAGYGLSDVTYTYTVGGVDNTITKQVFVNDKPVVGINVSSLEVCVNDSPVLLTGFPSGGVFLGPVGVSGNTFDPAVAGPGTFLVAYVYTDGNLCTNSISKNIKVNPLPIVSFYNLSPQYCLDAAPLGTQLVGNPSGGYFSGDGMLGDKFYPGLATIGSHTITYTYTDANGCTNHQDQIVKISPLPGANFKVDNICNSKTANFTDLSSIDESLGDTIKSWNWIFGDGIISNLQNPSHLYANADTYNVILRVTTNNNCANTISIPVTIGTIPVVNFTWDKICENNLTSFNDSTYFPLSNSGPNLPTDSLISSWSWNFGDPASGINNTSGLKNPNHLFSTFGIYKVKLKVLAKSGCTDSLTRRVYILPSKTVTPVLPYYEDFNSSNGGWVQDERLKDSTKWSWDYGNPKKAHIKLPDGDKAWVTSLDTTYKNMEESYVYSPCFDISALNKPVISLKIFTDVQAGFDGAVLQASVNGGKWIKVGQKGTGINWYNASSISSNPGNETTAEGGEGWSVEKQGWVDAKYDLNAAEFYQASNIKFRIAFNSNGDNPIFDTLDGFSFDNVFIGERERVVLLEHFTNSTQVASLSENNVVNKKVATSGNELIDIQYHTNFPSPDSLYNNNPNDQSARALFYGVPVTPRTIIDGKYQNTLLSKDSSYLNTRKLTVPFFKIDIKFPPSPLDSFTVKAVVTPKINLAKDSIVIVQIAVIEKSVVINNIVYNNVLRKLLPNAAGTRINHAWQANVPDSVTITTALVKNINVSDPSNLAVIVFVQSANKEIYQAAYMAPNSVPNVLTGVEQAEFIGDFNIYPNPANQVVNIDFGKPVSSGYSWSVYDMLGKQILKGVIHEGQNLLDINTSYIKQGTYIFEIRRKNKGSKNKRLLIIH